MPRLAKPDLRFIFFSCRLVPPLGLALLFGVLLPLRLRPCPSRDDDAEIPLDRACRLPARFLLPGRLGMPPSSRDLLFGRLPSLLLPLFSKRKQMNMECKKTAEVKLTLPLLYLHFLEELKEARSALAC